GRAGPAVRSGSRAAIVTSAGRPRSDAAGLELPAHGLFPRARTPDAARRAARHLRIGPREPLLAGASRRGPTAVGAAMSYFWVAVGSALGGMARYGCTGLAARLFGASFPWGTLIVNVSGSLLIGALAALLAPENRLFGHPDARAFLAVGL